MTEEFKKEIELKIKGLNQQLNSITNFWMDGKFLSENNFRIGRSIDFLNKSIDQLNKVLKS